MYSILEDTCYRFDILIVRSQIKRLKDICGSRTYAKNREGKK